MSNTTITSITPALTNIETTPSEPSQPADGKNFALTKLTSSAFYEFSKRLEEGHKKVILDKWEIDRVQSQAPVLVSELRSSTAYTTPVFSDPDVEFIAFYAAAPERDEKDRLTIYELSSILTYKTACDVAFKTFKTPDVKVHFLKDVDGNIRQAELTSFRSTICNLPNYPSWQNRIEEHFKNANIPHHQMVYFSMPVNFDEEAYYKARKEITADQVVEKALRSFVYVTVAEEKRRFIPTPELYNCFTQIPYPNNPSKSVPGTGNFTNPDFENFFERPLEIPNSLTPCPERTDTRITINKINHLMHDYYHGYIDKANPYLKALEELYPIIKSMPYAETSPEYQNATKYGLKSYPSLIETFLDREYGVNIQYGNIAHDSRFWLCILSVFELYSQCLMVITKSQQVTQGHLKTAAKQLISYIKANQKKWSEQHGITLTSLDTLASKLQDMNGANLNLNFQQICLIGVLSSAQTFE